MLKFQYTVLFLLFASVFSQFPFNNDAEKLRFEERVKDNQRFSYMASEIIDVVIDAVKEQFQDQKEESFSKLFHKGIFEGFGAIETSLEVTECGHSNQQILPKLQDAMSKIASLDPDAVKEGIMSLGEALEIMLTFSQTCQNLNDRSVLLFETAQILKNHQAFSYTRGKSILINQVEIVPEISNALEAYNIQDYANMGYWIGQAIRSLSLGMNKVLDQTFADYLNKVSGWKAEVPKKFEGMTLQQIKERFLGAQKIDYSQIDNLKEYNYEGLQMDIPDYFNASEQWPGCIHPIRDQGNCGSCWAFAGSEVLSDRFCIASNGSVQVVLSPQYLVSCDKPLGLGCHGGVPLFSWWFMSDQGIVTEECLPYMSGNGSNPLKCEDFKTCQDGSPIKKYYGLKGSAVVLTNPKSIKANMLKYGPIDAAFIVFEDFMYYSGGIYKHTSGKIVGLHAVKIIGWGTENGENYWIVANSWSESWGENGFFKIAFGQCGIDSATATGQADLTRLPR